MTQAQIDKIAKDLGIENSSDVASMKFNVLEDGRTEILISKTGQNGFYKVHTSVDEATAQSDAIELVSGPGAKSAGTIPQRDGSHNRIAESSDGSPVKGYEPTSQQGVVLGMPTNEGSKEEV